LNTRALLELTDSLRSSMLKGQSSFIGLATLIDALRVDEDGDGAKLDLETIMDTHLDKLIEDLLTPIKPSMAVGARLARIALVAETVQKMWIKRFKADFFKIHQMRRERMVATGCLRDVTFINFDSAGAGA
jgi:hypothetical protein